MTGRGAAARSPRRATPAAGHAGRRVDELIEARCETRRERKLRRDPVHSRATEHPLQHLVQILVRSRHDPTQQVGVPRRDVHLEHLRNRTEMFEHLVVRALCDLEGGEREHAVAERLEIEVGAKAGDDAAMLQPVEPRLHGAASDTETPRQFEEPHARERSQLAEQGGVERIDRAGHDDQSVAPYAALAVHIVH